MTELLGDKELMKALDSVAKTPARRKAGDVMRKASKKLSRRIEAAINAKVGEESGNLKKAVVEGSLRIEPGTGGVGSFVMMSYKRAPHAWLVEFGGTNRRRAKSAKMLRFEINGEVIYAKEVAPMPARPYFRPTVDRYGNQIMDKAKEDIWKVIEKEWSD